jgi:hypothetical protein
MLNLSEKIDLLWNFATNLTKTSHFNSLVEQWIGTWMETRRNSLDNELLTPDISGDYLLIQMSSVFGNSNNSASRSAAALARTGPPNKGLIFSSEI